jgi:hypothetical protein
VRPENGGESRRSWERKQRNGRQEARRRRPEEGASPLLSGCMPGLRPDTLKARSLEKHPERELNGTIGSHPLKGGFRGWRCARNAD